MKKCIYCNNAIDDHYRICPYCGEDQDYTSFYSKKQTVGQKRIVHRVERKEEERPNNYSLIVFLVNSLLIAALSYLFVKQWKMIPLVFLVFMGLQYGLAFISFQIGKLAFDLDGHIQDFFDRVGDYSLPGVLISVLILFASFFLSGRLIQFALALDLTLILTASLAVLLGPAKRIYALLVGFFLLFLAVILFFFSWFDFIKLII